MTTAEVYPFADVDDDGSFPAWIRGLRKVSGVYVIRERGADAIAYVGESSTDRLYATLTRHFQRWTNKYDTAGATFDRDDVEVAVIVVPAEHARLLQNELICVLEPEDNRLVCDHMFEPEEAEDFEMPHGYGYDVDLLLEGMMYEWPEDDDLVDLDDVPF